MNTPSRLSTSPRKISASTSNRLAIVLALTGGIASLPNSAQAQPRHGQLRPVYIVPVQSTAGRAVQDVVNGTNNNDAGVGAPMSFVEDPDAATPSQDAAVVESADAGVIENTANTNTDAGSQEITDASVPPQYVATPTIYNEPSSQPTNHQCNNWNFGIGFVGSMIPGWYGNPEVQQNNLNISAGNCSPELSATGATGRYLCSVTLTGGNGQFTLQNISGVDITTAPGNGRNAVIAVPGSGFGRLTVTSNGVSRTFNVAARAVGSNAHTFTTETVNSTEAPSAPLHVTFVPAIEAFADRHFGCNWGIEASARLGIAVTESRPDLYYFGARAGVTYRPNPRSPFTFGLRTGVDTFPGLTSGVTTTTAIPFDAMMRITTNPEGAGLYFNPSLGITVPTDGSSVLFNGSVGVGIEVR